MQDAATQLLDQYHQESYSRLLHHIIKECLEHIEGIRRYEYSSHYDLRDIEDRLLQFHNAIISGEAVSQYQLTPIMFKLHRIFQSCVVNDYHFGRTALLFGILGAISSIIAYLSVGNDRCRYYSLWGTGIGFFGILILGFLYLDLNI